jgi:hypothetical protein
MTSRGDLIAELVTERFGPPPRPLPPEIRERRRVLTDGLPIERHRELVKAIRRHEAGQP